MEGLGMGECKFCKYLATMLFRSLVLVPPPKLSVFVFKVGMTYLDSHSPCNFICVPFTHSFILLIVNSLFYHYVYCYRYSVMGEC